MEKEAETEAALEAKEKLEEKLEETEAALDAKQASAEKHKKHRKRADEIAETAIMRNQRLEKREPRQKKIINELKEENNVLVERLDMAREGQQERYEETQQMKMMLAR